MLPLTAIALSASAATASDIPWVAPSGGNFQIPQNWQGGQVPGATNQARFELGSTYGVSLTAPVQTSTLTLTNGRVTLNLQGNAYTALTGPSALRVGSTSWPMPELTLKGGVMTVNGADIATSAGFNGLLTIDGPSAKLSSTWGSMLLVGRFGNGQVMIRNGGELAAGLHTHIGYATGGTGHLTVTGNGSKWTAGGDLYCGYLGHGTAIITAGGAATSQNVIIGGGVGGHGFFHVVGQGSSSSSVFKVSVGSATGSTGTLSIEQGGYIYSGIAAIGEFVNSAGGVVITGTNSWWHVHNGMNVGLYGYGELIVSEGGRLTSRFGRLGYAAGASGYVRIDGLASHWAAQDYINVGTVAGTAAVMSVENGGKVTSPLITIGAGGSLSGEGTVEGYVFNHGLVQPGAIIDLTHNDGGAGTLTISGTFEQSATGRLAVDLFSANPEDNARLVVNGHAVLDGTLEINLRNGFIPSPGDEFRIVQGQGVFGSFHTIVQPENIGGAFAYVGPCNAPNTFTLRFTPTSQGNKRGGAPMGPPPAASSWYAVGDLNEDCRVDVMDLLMLLLSWGPCPDCPADLNYDGAVNVLDKLILLGNWGW
ncbi:MAG TPA: hypothetical protein PK098_13605 [Phycisphaerales bacterium]|nr:hypothetical protein [Phycisphaerales bacterium]